MAKPKPCVAVLYQAIPPPVIDGMKKPMKPGGYRDSGADIAYVLRSKGAEAVTPTSNPDPHRDEDWCFPDYEEGILDAVSKGATHLWANTILFGSHPIQTSQALNEYPALKLVGQPPHLVNHYDDKNYVNSLLRSRGDFTLPQSWIISSEDLPKLSSLNPPLSFPLIAKPIRGRGSQGVKLCQNLADLKSHAKPLLADSSSIMLEQYLSGVEGTVTIMPPSSNSASGTSGYKALPIVLRFNHEDGVAPYNGVVAVTQNSRAVPEKELTPCHKKIMSQCEKIAEILRVTAPIKIDVRQVTDDEDSDFAVFDVNMKPNMTGPGRPGREDQASLTAMAAAELGWDYGDLLLEILETARPLKEVREVRLPEIK